MSKAKQNKLEDVSAAILANHVCPELAAQAMNLVMGDGNADADIVFIGEAPGKNEDEQGLPFVGASGKFLNDMLASAGLERSDVYITNIVKYRPPNNRDPSPQEKQAFWPYLAEQLEIIQPKVIVTLGRHSMEFFLPSARISEQHGQAVRVTIQHPDGKGREWLVVPLYHPAAALYNGSLRQTLIDDSMQVVSALNKY
ncbi:MAG: uracil-DNA glycosylase [Patescibacteria group bacterium]|jgi:uracil-DNA glycosylase family 4|nr:uracil-DNA glycosylase [Patescibacteria group bacterium]